jgi:predicted exporter
MHLLGSRNKLWVAAILLPVAVATIFLATYYSYEGPWINAPKWIARAAMPVSMGAGIGVFLFIPFRSALSKIASLIAYLVISYIALSCYGLLYSCLSGDCI